MTKKKVSKDDIRKIEKSAVRSEMKEQGAFDGRYRSKVVPSKKAYKRKPKNEKGKDS